MQNNIAVLFTNSRQVRLQYIVHIHIVYSYAMSAKYKRKIIQKTKTRRGALITGCSNLTSFTLVKWVCEGARSQITLLTALFCSSAFLSLQHCWCVSTGCPKKLRFWNFSRTNMIFQAKFGPSNFDNTASLRTTENHFRSFGLLRTTQDHIGKLRTNCRRVIFWDTLYP